MSDRDKASEAADTLIADARRADVSRDAGKLHFLAGAVLSRAEIARYGVNATRLKEARRHAQRDRPLQLAILALLLLIVSAALVGYSFSVPMVLLLCVAAATVQRRSRQRVLEYLEQHPERSATRPPPA